MPLTASRKQLCSKRTFANEDFSFLNLRLVFPRLSRIIADTITPLAVARFDTQAKLWGAKLKFHISGSFSSGLLINTCELIQDDRIRECYLYKMIG